MPSKPSLRRGHRSKRGGGECERFAEMATRALYIVQTCALKPSPYQRSYSLRSRTAAFVRPHPSIPRVGGPSRLHACRRAAPRPLPLPRPGFFADACVGGGGEELVSSSSESSSRARPFPPLRPAGSRAPPPEPPPPPASSRSIGFQSRNRRRQAALPISWYSSRVTARWANSGRRAKVTAARYVSRIGLAGRRRAETPVRPVGQRPVALELE